MAARVDAATRLSAAQAITASAASTNSMDMADANHMFGATKERIRLIVSVNTTFSGSATSIDFALRDSADNSAFADTSIKVSGVATSLLTAGTLVMAVQFPETGGQIAKGQGLGRPLPGPAPVRRYIDVYYTLNGGALSAGKMDAFFDVF